MILGYRILSRVGYLRRVDCVTLCVKVGRAGLRPMQLHWAPRLWRPPAMVFGHVVHFYKILLALEKVVEMADKPQC